MRKMRVTGVVTQGASRAGSAEYLKTFKVAYSVSGRKFQFIQSTEGMGDKVRALRDCGPHPVGLQSYSRAPSGVRVCTLDD